MSSGDVPIGLWNVSMEPVIPTDVFSSLLLSGCSWGGGEGGGGGGGVICGAMTGLVYVSSQALCSGLRAGVPPGTAV